MQSIVRNFCVFASLTLFTCLAKAAPLLPHYEDATLHAVQFVDANEGWVAGDEGVIWHTIDGGKHWERQKTGTRASLRSLQFLSPYTGFATGRIDTPTGSQGVILKTKDGGQTWQELLAGILPGLQRLHFLDDRNGLACGDSSPSFPGGIFTTSDGGQSWRPQNAFTAMGWQAAAFADASSGCLVGRWGQVVPFASGKFEILEKLPTGGRTLRGLASQGKLAVLVGDGGLAMIATDWPGRSWTSINLPVPAEARAVCDFHAASISGERIVLAGKPGSVVFVSPDAGKTWQAQPTPITAPIHAITMISASRGWAVGELGTILGTDDGGMTWSVRKTAAQRLAVLCVNATADTVPFSIVPNLGEKDGYHTGGLAVTSADLTTAEPRKASDDTRLSQAMRLAGGTSGEMLWAFPLPEHARGLSPEQLLGYWDRHQGGKARDQLLRQLVLAIRTSRPDVILGDSQDPGASAAEQIVLAAVREAFKLAGDTSVFPEQMATLHLQPHAAKKLFARTENPEKARVVMATDTFEPELTGTAASCCWEATRLFQQTPSRRLLFSLQENQLPDAEKHPGFMDGCDLARGGTARRAAPEIAFGADFVATRREAFARLQTFDSWLSSLTSTSESDFEQVWKTGRERLLEVPDTLALPSLLDRARELIQAGKAPLARELYRIAADRFPSHPATTEAHRWLAGYQSSSEAIRRIELGDVSAVRPMTFVQLPDLPPSSPPDLVQVAFSEAIPARTRVKFRSSEAEMQWRLNSASEEQFYILNPFEAREPVFALTGNAARLRMGLTADAERALTVYHHRVLGRMTAGMNPWFDAVASEQWLANRPKDSAPAKPMSVANKFSIRPQLDGKLDEVSWTQAEVLPVAVGSAELSARYPTEARFAFDADFLYIGIRAQHPQGEQQAKATARKRDEDLAAFDRVEILLDLDRDYTSYWRLCVDQRGCVAEDCTGDRSWNPRWFVATESNETGWTAEIAIPIVELSSSPIRDQNVWAMNVVRVLPGQGVLSWCGPADARPRTEGMGLLEFRTK